MLSTDIQHIGQLYPQYLRDVEKNYRWNFAVMALDASFFSFAVGVLSQDTIIPYFVTQLTTSRLLVGLIPALYYLGLFGTQLVGAFLIHGSATRKWKIFSIAVAERLGILAIAGIAQFVSRLTHPVALVLLAGGYALFTITSGLIGPAYADFISKNIIRRRGMFYGVSYGLGNVFGLAAGLVSAYLFNRYAFPQNLQRLFWLAFASSFVSPFLIAGFREVPFPGSGRAEPLSEFIRAIPRSISGSPDLQRYMLTRAVLGLGILANAFYALAFLERLHPAAGYVGVFTLIILLSQGVFGLLWGWLGDRIGFRRVFVIIALLVAMMGLLALTTVGVQMSYLVAVCQGSVYAGLRIGDANMVLEMAPPAETSRFVGIANTCLAPTMILAAVLGGGVAQTFSYRILFLIVVAVGAVATVLILRYMPDPRTRVA